MNGYKLAINDAYWPIGAKPEQAEAIKRMRLRRAILGQRQFAPSREPILKEAELLGLSREHQMK